MPVSIIFFAAPTVSSAQMSSTLESKEQKLLAQRHLNSVGQKRWCRRRTISDQEKSSSAFDLSLDITSMDLRIYILTMSLPTGRIRRQYQLLLLMSWPPVRWLPIVLNATGSLVSRPSRQPLSSPVMSRPMASVPRCPLAQGDRASSRSREPKQRFQFGWMDPSPPAHLATKPARSPR
jgi:hypothetical protein